MVDVLTYIDDTRPTAPCEEEFRQVARKYTFTFNYYGVQNNHRKRRPPSTTTGEWAGTVVHSDDDQVSVKVTDDIIERK
jgi:hypothetical protein